ncbi:hypothetical protein ACQR0Z_21205 [Bradyrhizobium sp. HKCCYLS3077]|uniref:hypothetical protein n=1 Tax=Bradyrhizobium sp. HKCCYLS3077 TaxID=3420761 RepID=UPI003EB6D3FE
MSAILITPSVSTMTSAASVSFAARIAREMSACVTLAGRRGIEHLHPICELHWSNSGRRRERHGSDREQETPKCTVRKVLGFPAANVWREMRVKRTVGAEFDD